MRVCGLRSWAQQVVGSYSAIAADRTSLETRPNRQTRRVEPLLTYCKQRHAIIPNRQKMERR